LDKIEAKMINNDDTFSEVSSFNSEVYYRSKMVRSHELSVDEHYDLSENEIFLQEIEFEEWLRIPTARYSEYQKGF